MGHVALRVTDLDGAVERATSIMGLRVTGRADNRVDLTHGKERYSLQFIASDVDALDHVGFEAASPEAVAEIKLRLERAGATILSESPIDDALEAGLTFEIPAGVVFEVYTGMPKDQPDYVPSGVRPTHLGHVNMRLEDPGPSLEFLQDVLDFRFSDKINGGAFMRCNEEHHAVVFTPGVPVLHHHAWAVQSVADLARLGDCLYASGDSLVEGPVRHGIGNNVAAYFKGTGGEIIEYYTDMEQIHDDDGYVPGEWVADAANLEWYSHWTPRMPMDAFRQSGIPYSAGHLASGSAAAGN